MTRSEHLLILLEELRIPLHDPASATDWKDWYHFILLNMDDGIRILANAALSGRPGQGQITVTALVTVPAGDSDDFGSADGSGVPRGTYGCCRDVDWADAMVHRHPLSMKTPGFECAIQGAHSRFSIRDDRSRLDLKFEGTAEATPLLVPEIAPYGSGFIGWGFLPGIAARGRYRVGGRAERITPGRWYCYHDHNYGRFRWGEDIGWIWFVAHLRSGDGTRFTLVLHRGNSRDREKKEVPFLFLYKDNALEKVFLDATVGLEWKWSADPRRPERLPGSMATLFSARKVVMPEAIMVSATDEIDSVSCTMTVTSSLELVLPDNEERQYTFIEELNGDAASTISLQGSSRKTGGLFYAEYVR